MIAPAIVGAAHRDTAWEHFTPFAIGQVDPSRGYVHVFDDTTLDVVMRTMDTVTDFVEYLSRKEAFIESGRLIWAPGEEDLLAYYLRVINSENEHDFIVPEGNDALAISEGDWQTFCRSPQRLAQIEADKGSYLWDWLIEKFTHHFVNRTADYCSHSTYDVQERVLRIFARESRFRRRMLSSALRGIVEKGMANDRGTRVIPPLKPGDPYYVFLTLKQGPDVPNEEYRKHRREALGALCWVTKLMYPEAREIAGIATEPGLSHKPRSEDALYLDASVWSEQNNAMARALQAKHGFLTKLSEHKYHASEYPPVERPPTSPKREPTSLRNSLCPCGSGRKFKRCCGGR